MSTDGDADSSSGWRTKLCEQIDDFFGVDLRTLALVRIALAVTVLMLIAYLAGDIEIFFVDGGIFPDRDAGDFRHLEYRLSIHSRIGSYGGQLALFGLHAVAAICLLVGYRTRLSSVMTWLLTVSLLNCIHLASHRADTLLCLMLLWGMLTPWGARYSLDALRKTTEKIPDRVVSLGTAGLIVQMPLVYGFGAWKKLTADPWVSEFSAVYYATLPQYVTPIGEFVAAHQPYVVTQFLTGATVVLQVVGPVLIFCPVLVVVSAETRRRWLARLRIGVFAACSLFQLGLLAMVAVGLFPIISIAALLPVIPTRWWSWLESRPRWDRCCRRVERRAQRLVGDPDLPAGRVGSGWAVTGVALVVWGMVVTSCGTEARLFSMEYDLREFQRSSRVLQSWGMFTNPQRGIRHYVMEGHLADGRRVDVFDEGGPIGPETGGPISWEMPTPPRSSSYVAGYRWRLSTVMMTRGAWLEQRYERTTQRQYGGYVCGAWNELHDGPDRLERIRMHELLFRIPDPPNPPEEVAEGALMTTHYCY